MTLEKNEVCHLLTAPCMERENLKNDGNYFIELKVRAFFDETESNFVCFVMVTHYQTRLHLVLIFAFIDKILTK